MDQKQGEQYHLCGFLRKGLDMKAKNKVMNGEYNGKIVGCVPTHAFIILGFTKSIRLTKENVESYELLNSEQSNGSSAMKTMVSGAIFGVAGALAASSKQTGIYQVVINFKDGKRSLLEIDEKVYKALVTGMF